MRPHWNIATLETGIPIRQEIFEGRPHLVAPVVALVEGVHVGSGGALFYPGDEIAKYVEAWNGIPLPVFHPEEYGTNVSANSPEQIEERSVGRLFNVFFDPDGSKLKGELWIDIGKADKISPEVLSLIRSGQHLEVSTALWADDDNSPGEWRGEEFVVIARNYRPDHLALLPGGEGACSWTDGCGVRLNNPGRGGSDMEFEKNVRGSARTPREKFQFLIRSIGKGLGFVVDEKLVVQESSHDELRTKLQKALDALDNQGWMHFVREVYDDSVIYEARGNNPSETGSPAGVAKLYRRGYSIDENENVTLKDDAEEVREERKYVPVENKSTIANEDKNKKHKEVIVDKKELIEGLIACDRTKFEDGDREWLDTLSVEQLEKLKASDKPPEGNEEEKKKEAEKKETGEDKAKEKESVAPTVDEFIAKAPAEVQSVLHRAVNRDRSIKEDLVKALLANERNSFSEEELKAKDIGELERLIELGRVEVDYSGRAGGPGAGKGDEVPVMPPTFEPAAK